MSEKGEAGEDYQRWVWLVAQAAYTLLNVSESATELTDGLVSLLLPKDLRSQLPEDVNALLDALRAAYEGIIQRVEQQVRSLPDLKKEDGRAALTAVYCCITSLYTHAVALRRTIRTLDLILHGFKGYREARHRAAQEFQHVRTTLQSIWEAVQRGRTDLYI